MFKMVNNIGKKLILLALVIILSISLYTVSPVRAYYCYSYSLSTERDHYYLDENLIINASWELEYNPLEEISYIFCEIIDNDIIVWNSSQNDVIGVNNEVWTISLLSIIILSTRSSALLLINLVYYYENILTTTKFSIVIMSINTIVQERDSHINASPEGDEDIDTLSSIISILLLPFLSVIIVISVYLHKQKQSRPRNLIDLTIKY